MGQAPTVTEAAPRSARPSLLLFAAAVCLLIVLCLLSLAVGARQIPLGEVLRALFDPQGGGEVEDIVRGLRVPRTLLGLTAGAALGLSGAVMQAVTRNPLADPGLMGITAGSAFAMVLAVGVLGVTALYGYVWFALAGALGATVAVHLLGSIGRSGLTPVKLALAGVAITTLLSSVTSAVSLVDPEALNRYRFWAAGSLANQDAGVLVRVLPFILVGGGLALASAPALNALALGDDVAASLGRRLGLVRLQAALAVTLLTGAAVAVTGPLVFIGLVVPHAARALCQLARIGPDHRRMLPLCMVLAPCLLVGADIAGRLIARPQEIQVGIISAFIGAPFFIALVRRRRLAEL
jgi:iron complex transport system permease protein